MSVKFSSSYFVLIGVSRLISVADALRDIACSGLLHQISAK